MSSAPGDRLRTLWSRRPEPPASVLAGIVVLQVVILIHFARSQWFAGDDWDFLLTRGTIPGAGRGWFAPHADHWTTSTIAIFRLLFSLVGMHHLPYALIPIAMHVVIVVCTHRLLVRAGTGRWVAVAATGMLVFLGAGAEAMLWATTMSLLGSIMCGLLALLVCVRTSFGRAGILGAWTLLLLGLTFSGAGITAIVLVTGYALVSRGVRVASRVAGAPLFVFLVWYLWIGHEATETAVSSASVYLQVPAFVWVGLTETLTRASGIPGAGPLILLSLVVVLLTSRTPSPALRHLAWAGLIAAVAQQVLAGSVRIGQGVQAATVGRYSYTLMVLLTPAIALLITVVVSKVVVRHWIVGALAASFLLGYGINAVLLERQYVAFSQASSGPWPPRLAGLFASADAGERILTNGTGRQIDGPINASLMASEQIRRAVPARRATPANRLDAESLFFVGVGRHDQGLFQPAPVELAFGFRDPVQAGAGCHSYLATADNPVVILPIGNANQIGVQGPATTVISSLVRGQLRSPDRGWRVRAEVPFYVASTAQNTDLTLTFNHSGTYVICNH